MNEVALFGRDLFGNVTHSQELGPKDCGILNERFTLPPFTILDAKSGVWQARKRAWISLGIQSEIGRDDAHAYNTDGTIDGCTTTGTSVFDPVLCELAYRWFCPSRGTVVDPFAGGSVRGVVAAEMGAQYWGVDLRPEQIAANIEQGCQIMPDPYAVTGKPHPVWVCGDSEALLPTSPLADFVFSCPPYGDLEVYSSHRDDLSNMPWSKFCAKYLKIIHLAVSRLRDNSFACFVVGDFRDRDGFYKNFVSDTIAAFESCSCRLYNEAILATPIGTASQRVTKQFEALRKLAKIHQNVLVFCKGDPRIATQKIRESANE